MIDSSCQILEIIIYFLLQLIILCLEIVILIVKTIAQRCIINKLIS